MPYTIQQKIKHRIQKKQNKLIKKMQEDLEDRLQLFEKESNTIWMKSINSTFEELYKEAVNMYDTLIEEYYKYKTTSYYRHHVGIGTGTGENLYFGKQFTLTSGLIPELSMDFSGKDMDKYQYNSTDEVLDMVMHGIRGVPSKGWWTTWKGSYNGKYFSVGGVDIATAFNAFYQNFDYLSRYIFKEKINEEKMTGKYQFFK